MIHHGLVRWFACLEMVLAKLGYKFEKGKAVAAVQDELLKG